LFKLKLIFISSLVLLVGLFISTMFMNPSTPEPAESKRAHILKGENGWIVQYDIKNTQANQIKYTITVTMNTVTRKDSVEVQPGKSYSYTYHIPARQPENEQVTLALFEEDKAEPVEKITYYLNIN
jgi:hypothetical protein